MQYVSTAPRGAQQPRQVLRQPATTRKRKTPATEQPPAHGDPSAGAVQQPAQGDTRSVCRADSSAAVPSDRATQPTAASTPRRVNRRLRPELVEEMVQSYRAGRTVKEIAQQFGFHRETVATHLKRAGLTLRTNVKDEAFCQRVRQTYETIGTVKGAAQRLGVSKDTVRKVLQG